MAVTFHRQGERGRRLIQRERAPRRTLRVGVTGSQNQKTLMSQYAQEGDDVLRVEHDGMIGSLLEQGRILGAKSQQALNESKLDLTGWPCGGGLIDQSGKQQKHSCKPLGFTASVMADCPMLASWRLGHGTVYAQKIQTSENPI